MGHDDEPQLANSCGANAMQSRTASFPRMGPPIQCSVVGLSAWRLGETRGWGVGWGGCVVGRGYGVAVGDRLGRRRSLFDLNREDGDDRMRARDLLVVAARADAESVARGVWM